MGATVRADLVISDVSIVTALGGWVSATYAALLLAQLHPKQAQVLSVIALVSFMRGACVSVS